MFRITYEKFKIISLLIRIKSFCFIRSGIKVIFPKKVMEKIQPIALSVGDEIRQI